MKTLAVLVFALVCFCSSAVGADPTVASKISILTPVAVPAGVSIVVDNFSPRAVNVIVSGMGVPIRLESSCDLKRWIVESSAPHRSLALEPDPGVFVFGLLVSHPMRFYRVVFSSPP